MRLLEIAQHKHAQRAALAPTITALKSELGTWAKTASALKRAEVPMPSGGSNWTGNSALKFMIRAQQQ